MHCFLFQAKTLTSYRTFELLIKLPLTRVESFVIHGNQSIRQALTHMSLKGTNKRTLAGTGLLSIHLLATNHIPFGCDWSRESENTMGNGF